MNEAPSTGYQFLPFYRSVPWGAAYWRELHAVGAWYHPYVVWRREPFRGRFINVDTAGVRRTPGADCRPGAYRVFALGGSVMWGYGARDTETIPALLQSALARRLARPVCVVNLSDHGFNSTQDRIELEQHLLRGDVPDLVVSLQGANDLWAAYASGQPGVHGFLGEVANKLERDPATLTGRGQLLRHLAIVRLVHPPKPLREVTHWTMPDTTLADSVVDVYFANYEIVRALARRYGFDYAFFWQPVIHAGRKPLVPLERRLRARDLAKTVPAWPHMIARAFADVARAGPRDGHFHDLSGAFDAAAGGIYIDYVHVVPAGDRILADSILAALAPAPRRDHGHGDEVALHGIP